MIYFKVLIPAAGKGSRSKLNYPKTLFKINNEPIIIKILKKMKKYDKYPTIIASPNGKKIILETIKKYNYDSEILIQNKPLGMGHAILQFERSNDYKKTKNIILIWGDIPFLRQSSLDKLITTHLKNKNDLTLITGNSKKPYTYVKRDNYDKIISIKENKNLKNINNYGERDVGVFIFDKKKIFETLKKNITKKINLEKKEFGFLFIIEKLVIQGFKIEGINIANNREMISFNQMNDLKLLR